MTENDPVLSALDQEISALEARLAAAVGAGVAPGRVIIHARPDERPEDAGFGKRPIAADDDPAILAKAKEFPGQLIIVRKLFESPHRRAGRPDVDGSHAIPSRIGVAEHAVESAVPAADEPDVVERARDRLANLRGGF
jgi:hypothetical protein